MIGAAGRRRRRARSDGATRIGVDRRAGGLVRWQGGPRRGGGVWTLVAIAAGLLALALVAARTAGWLHWGNLLMLIPAAVLTVTFGAGLIALARRGLAWLAG
jgi:hypothetical protein